MSNSIFSTYSTTENLVTSTILAVFERLKNKICEENQTNITDDWKNNYKYLILTEKEKGKTFKIDKPIKNNKTSYSDKKTAFVQKQTYLNIEQLKGKKFTSELEKYNQL